MHPPSFIRIFDIDKHKWARKITFPNMEKPMIKRIFNDNGSIIMQINEGKWGVNRGIYTINKKGNINRIGDLTGTQSLAGIDHDFFYAIERKDVKNAKGERTKWVFVGVKYNRKTKNRIEYHFEQNPKLVVRDVWDDDQNYWYACFHEGTPRNYAIPEGKLVLVSKSKLNSKVEEFYIDSGNWKFDAHILGDQDWIWIFKNPRESDGSFIMFSKAGKTYETIKLNIRPLRPFTNQNFNIEDNYLWVLSTSPSRREWQIYFIDKERIRATPIDLPNNIRPSGAIYADKDYLWVDVYKLRKHYTPSGNQIPYLLRIAKSDLSYELIFVKPTIGDAIGTVFENFMSWLLSPFFRG